MIGWEWKCGGMKKVSLYKFTHTLLLKNDAQLIQISDQQPKKKKSRLNRTVMPATLGNQKKKRKKKKEEATSREKKKKKTLKTRIGRKE